MDARPLCTLGSHGGAEPLRVEAKMCDADKAPPPRLALQVRRADKKSATGLRSTPTLDVGRGQLLSALGKV